MRLKNLILLGIIVIASFSLLGCKKDKDQPVEAANQKVFRLLIVDAQKGEPYTPTRDSMLKKLEELGYSEEKNLEVTKFNIGNDLEKGKEILKREIAKDYDVYFINGSVTAAAAKEVVYGNDKHNFVFASVTDPVGIGLIDDFKNPPKANFTGVCYPVPVASRVKFVKRLMPEVKTIGLIYSDMPQSHSYRKWLEEALAEDPELAGINIIFKMVPLISGQDGSKLMAEEARPIIKELDSQVDVFMAPNDQMGVQPGFAQVVYEESTKPLCGIGDKEVMGRWGAAMAMFPNNETVGLQTADMVAKLFSGGDIKDIIPQWPKNYGVAFDMEKIEEFDIEIPVDLVRLAGENFSGVNR